MHQVCQPLSALGDNTNQRWVNLPRSRCRGCSEEKVLMRPKMLGLSSPRAAPPHELGHTSKPTGVSAHLRLDTVLPPACRPLYTNQGRHCYYLRVTAALGVRGGRLTSSDASFMRCFGFFQTSSKTSRSMFFSKHR